MRVLAVNTTNRRPTESRTCTSSLYTSLLLKHCTLGEREEEHFEGQSSPMSFSLRLITDRLVSLMPALLPPVSPTAFAKNKSKLGGVKWTPRHHVTRPYQSLNNVLTHQQHSREPRLLKCLHSWLRHTYVYTHTHTHTCTRTHKCSGALPVRR